MKIPYLAPISDLHETDSDALAGMGSAAVFSARFQVDGGLREKHQPSSCSLGRTVCLCRRPERSSQQHEVLDQKLSGIAKDGETVLQLRRARR